MVIIKICFIENINFLYESIHKVRIVIYTLNIEKLSNETSLIYQIYLNKVVNQFFLPISNFSSRKKI